MKKEKEIFTRIGTLLLVYGMVLLIGIVGCAKQQKIETKYFTIKSFQIPYQTDYSYSQNENVRILKNKESIVLFFSINKDTLEDEEEKKYPEKIEELGIIYNVIQENVKELKGKEVKQTIKNTKVNADNLYQTITMNGNLLSEDITFEYQGMIIENFKNEMIYCLAIEIEKDNDVSSYFNDLKKSISIIANDENVNNWKETKVS